METGETLDSKNEEEIKKSKESEKPPKTGLVILGRGIELGRTGSKPKWRPTSLIEKSVRTGYRLFNLDKGDEETVIGGANANLLATAQLIEEMDKASKKPEILIGAAGCPPYLQSFSPEYPNLAEGKVIFEGLARKVDISEIEQEILKDNVDSIDDVIVAHQRALDLGLDKLVFITVDVHAPRIRDLIDLVKALNPKFAEVESEVLKAEEILMRRNRRYKKVVQEELNSDAYRRTWNQEQKGRKLLRDGTYRFKSKNELLKQYPEILHFGKRVFSQPL